MSSFFAPSATPPCLSGDGTPVTASFARSIILTRIWSWVSDSLSVIRSFYLRRGKLKFCNSYKGCLIGCDLTLGSSFPTRIGLECDLMSSGDRWALNSFIRNISLSEFPR